MRYPVRDPSDWNRVGKLPLVQWFKLHLRRRVPKVKGERGRSVSIAPVRIVEGPLSPSDVVLICVLKDAEALLPSFLQHYRSMGVARFAILDDKSSDKTQSILSGAPDVDVFSSPVSYSESNGGLIWRDLIVDHYGRDRWYISVDSDEYLVYPGSESRPISEFIGDLQRARLRRALAAMVDIYPHDGETTSTAASSEPPTTACPLMDGDGYFLTDEKLGVAVRGGPRRRMYGIDTRLTKFPVIYVDDRTFFSSGNAHAPLPFQRNFSPVVAVLLHHRFAPGFSATFQSIAASGTYAENSYAYRAIIESDGFKTNKTLNYEGSRRYAGSEDLVKAGYVKDLR